MHNRFIINRIIFPDAIASIHSLPCPESNRHVVYSLIASIQELEKYLKIQKFSIVSQSATVNEEAIRKEVDLRLEPVTEYFKLFKWHFNIVFYDTSSQEGRVAVKIKDMLEEVDNATRESYCLENRLAFKSSVYRKPQQENVVIPRAMESKSQSIRYATLLDKAQELNISTDIISLMKIVASVIYPDIQNSFSVILDDIEKLTSVDLLIVGGGDELARAKKLSQALNQQFPGLKTTVQSAQWYSPRINFEVDRIIESIIPWVVKRVESNPIESYKLYGTHGQHIKRAFEAFDRIAMDMGTTNCFEESLCELVNEKVIDQTLKPSILSIVPSFAEQAKRQDSTLVDIIASYAKLPEKFNAYTVENKDASGYSNDTALYAPVSVDIQRVADYFNGIAPGAAQIDEKEHNIHEVPGKSSKLTLCSGIFFNRSYVNALNQKVQSLPISRLEGWQKESKVINATTEECIQKLKITIDSLKDFSLTSPILDTQKESLNNLIDGLLQLKERLHGASAKTFDSKEINSEAVDPNEIMIYGQGEARLPAPEKYSFFNKGAHPVYLDILNEVHQREQAFKKIIMQDIRLAERYKGLSARLSLALSEVEALSAMNLKIQSGLMVFTRRAR